MRYRLDPVRGVRERAEKGARGELAGAVGAARITEADVARAAERTRVAAAQVQAARTARATLATAVAIARADRFVTRCLRALADARLEELSAREAHAGRLGAVDATRARLVAARADKEVIDRHFARWREQQRKLADRRSDD